MVDVDRLFSFLFPPLMIGLQRLTRFLRPRGLMRITLPNLRYIEGLSLTRKIITAEYPSIVFFDNNDDLPARTGRDPRKKDLQGTMNEFKSLPFSSLLLLSFPRIYFVFDFARHICF